MTPFLFVLTVGAISFLAGFLGSLLGLGGGILVGTRVRVGGLGRDLVASFLHELAHGAGITLHVRLLEGEDEQHVLDAIFKALGAALGALGFA